MSRNAPQFSASDLLQKIEFEEIDGFAADDLAAAFDAFRRSAEIIGAKAQEQRSAVAPPPSLAAAARAALGAIDHPGRFFQDWFRPHAIKAQGFVTAYYEVEVDARLSPEPGFTTPVLSRPRDLVTLNESPLSLPSGETLTSARRQADGALVPYPDRRAIEEEGAAPSAHPLAYVRDPVELFLIQVQGSARLRLPGGGVMALTYAGRNGWPYTSVGRLMIERGLGHESRDVARSDEGDVAAARRRSRRSGPPVDAGESFLCVLRDRCVGAAQDRPDRRAGRAADAVPLDRRRPLDLVLRPAVLDCCANSMARRGGNAISSTDDRAGHRICHNWSCARRSFFRRGRSGGPARRRHPARRRNDRAAAEGRWGRSVSEENSRRYARRLSQAEAELWTVATADVRPARARPRKHVSPTPAAEGPAPLAPSGPSVGRRPPSGAEASAAADRHRPAHLREDQARHGLKSTPSSIFTGCGRRRRSAR